MENKARASLFHFEWGLVLGVGVPPVEALYNAARSSGSVYGNREGRIGTPHYCVVAAGQDAAIA